MTRTRTAVLTATLGAVALSGCTAAADKPAASGELTITNCEQQISFPTPAKRLFGLRVRGTPGTKLPPGLLARRWLIKTAPLTVVIGIAFAIGFGAAGGRPLALAALSLVAGVFGLFAFLDVLLAQRHSRQAVHDRIVGAVVVRAGT